MNFHERAQRNSHVVVNQNKTSKKNLRGISQTTKQMTQGSKNKFKRSGTQQSDEGEQDLQIDFQGALDNDPLSKFEESKRQTILKHNEEVVFSDDDDDGSDDNSQDNQNSNDIDEDSDEDEIMSSSKEQQEIDSSAKKENKTNQFSDSEDGGQDEDETTSNH